MVGHFPLEEGILVRIQVPQPKQSCAYGRSFYKLPLKEKLNFFRTLEDSFINIVGTLKKGEGANAQQVVTSFLTSKPNYPQNIKKTAEAVYLKKPGGALIPSSLELKKAPSPAGAPAEAVSGVELSEDIITETLKGVKELYPSTTYCTPLDFD